MFSPSVAEATGPAAGTRSRRRQRPRSTDNLAQQPKAKRQRVPLSEQAFVNPEARTETVDAKPERPAAKEARRESVETTPAPKRELGIRTKKSKASERVSKGDGSAVLVGPPVSLLIRRVLASESRRELLALDSLRGAVRLQALTGRLLTSSIAEH